ncbi:MAG: thymidine phosphorylase, partial [candidate division WOR-3 bacterium]|nr:thymidine phosphorylase [candidate division WOR-3 bacterium]
MTVYEIILKKRSGQELTNDEIEFLVSGYTKNIIPDYQMSAFLMAVYFQGMTFDEITALTKAMIHSGKTFDLSSIPKPKIDKHSTGGVGDKVSLILAPLVASLGIAIPMVSGRSLGHTGGTLDKLESIPGFRTNLTEREFISQLKKIGVAMIGQTEELVPADKKIYALRDVTATVDSIPLIAASIMSKKLAEGIDGLVLDVKTGSGAFMRKERDAQKLAKMMIEIAKRMKKKVVALITNMEQPLGNMVGNALEVIESIECLKGNGPPDLMQVTIELATEMLMMAHSTVKKQAAKNKIVYALKSGLALEKFREIIKAQGGDPRVIENYNLLLQPKCRVRVISPESGYLQKLDALTIGLLSVELGCGRKTIDDKIDYSAGFVFKKKIGDEVKKGEVLLEIMANDQKKLTAVSEKILNAYKISKQ